MLGLVLLYVGAVLYINGLSMLGKINPKEAAIMNLFTGAISFIVALFYMADGNLILVQSAAYGLLFSFTYLWVAYNNLTKQDGRGLGWFSLFVAITALFITYDTYMNASTFFDRWFVFCWAMWAILWGLFFVIGALQKADWAKFTAVFTIIVAITTAWLPGYLLLSGHMPD